MHTFLDPSNALTQVSHCYHFSPALHVCVVCTESRYTPSTSVRPSHVLQRSFGTLHVFSAAVAKHTYPSSLPLVTSPKQFTQIQANALRSSRKSVWLCIYPHCSAPGHSQSPYAVQIASIVWRGQGTMGVLSPPSPHDSH